MPERETELVNGIVKHLPRWVDAPRDRLTVHREIAVGRSVSDVVACIRRKQRSPELQPLSILECVVLAALREGGASRIDLLEHRCGLTKRGLRNGQLDRLIDLGIVKRGLGGRVFARRRIPDGFTLIAIEAKLTRWREALGQAVAYKRYADKSYVALPCAVVNRNGIELDVFKGQGVGLLSTSRGGIREIVKAERSHAHDWRREYVVSRLAGNKGRSGRANAR